MGSRFLIKGTVRLSNSYHPFDNQVSGYKKYKRKGVPGSGLVGIIKTNKIKMIVFLFASFEESLVED